MFLDLGKTKFRARMFAFFAICILGIMALLYGANATDPTTDPQTGTTCCRQCAVTLFDYESGYVQAVYAIVFVMLLIFGYYFFNRKELQKVDSEKLPGTRPHSITYKVSIALILLEIISIALINAINGSPVAIDYTKFNRLKPTTVSAERFEGPVACGQPVPCGQAYFFNCNNVTGCTSNLYYLSSS